MPLLLSVDEIVRLGAQTGFLDIKDAYAAGIVNIRLLCLVGSLRSQSWYCPFHDKYHNLQIWDTCTDSFRSLYVFDANLEFLLGISNGFIDYQRELDELVRGGETADPDDDCEAFVIFRQWQIRHGRAW